MFLYISVNFRMRAELGNISTFQDFIHNNDD